MFRNMRNINSLFIIIIFTTSLSACKIDFEGDIYTSDLMDVLENRSQIDIHNANKFPKYHLVMRTYMICIVR